MDSVLKCAKLRLTVNFHEILLFLLSFCKHGWTFDKTTTNWRGQTKAGSNGKRRTFGAVWKRYFIRACAFFPDDRLGDSCRLKMFKNILPKLAEIFEHCKLNRHLTWTFWRTLAPRVNTSALGRFHVFWICRKGVCGKPLWFFKLDKGFASGHKHVRQGTKCTIKFWRKRAKNAGCQSNFLHDQLQGAIQQNLASHAAASRTLQHHLSPVSSSVEADYAAKSR